VPLYRRSASLDDLSAMFLSLHVIQCIITLFAYVLTGINGNGWEVLKLCLAIILICILLVPPSVYSDISRVATPTIPPPPLCVESDMECKHVVGKSDNYNQ
jgi:hypothetical protein